MLKRVAPGKWVVYSHDGKKKLSRPISHAAAKKRLTHVEMFKKGY